MPGSVFKIVTGIAGLNTGAIDPGTTFEEQPPAEEKGLVVEGFRVRDGHHEVTGDTALDMNAATEVSCNIWYALAGLETGGGRLADEAAKLGFGDSIPFDLPTAISRVTSGDGRAPGGFNDDAELASASFGQGETFVTPLQMALVASTVANDGVLMKPHLVTALTGEGPGARTIGPDAWRRVMSEEDARALQAAMRQAVEGRLGREFTPGAAVKGVPTAGKSGTAELGGKGEPHSWFIGFAPVDDPQVAIAVLVERGGRGGERAAPLAGTLMERFFELLREAVRRLGRADRRLVANRGPDIQPRGGCRAVERRRQTAPGVLRRGYCAGAYRAGHTARAYCAGIAADRAGHWPPTDEVRATRPTRCPSWPLTDGARHGGRGNPAPGQSPERCVVGREGPAHHAGHRYLACEPLADGWR